MSDEGKSHHSQSPIKSSEWDVVKNKAIVMISRRYLYKPLMMKTDFSFPKIRYMCEYVPVGASPVFPTQAQGPQVTV